MARYGSLGMALVVALIARLSSAGANRWTQQGPDGGRVSSIAIDPVVTDTAYAVAAVGGGLFKTVDGGAAWSHLLLPTEGTGRPVRPSTVVIDPFFSRNVWAFTDSQAFRSRNAGDTWTSQSIDDAPFITIAFSPVRPSLAFAGTGSGVWMSLDGGDHWTSTGLAAPVGQFCLDAFDESLILAVEFDATPVGAQYSVVHRSEDGGASWGDVHVEGGSGLGRVNAIIADPRHPATFFAAIGVAVMKSTDGGKSWSPTAPLPQDVGYANLLTWDGPLLLVGRSSGHFVSTSDGGDTWSAWNTVPPGDVGSLVFDPHEPSIGFLGGTSIYKTTDAGVTWGNADSGFHGTEFRALAVDPSDPQILYGSRDEESPEHLLISVDGGGHWRATGFSGGIPFGRHITMAIDPENTTTLYASTSTGLAKSTDRGDTWASTGLNFSPSQIEIDPKSGAQLYAVGDPGFVASDDGGDHWRTIEPSPGMLVQTLAIDPADSDILYATVQLGIQQSEVLKSENRGASWSVLWNTYLTFARILVDPSNSSIVYADTSSGFFRSTNGGATWSEHNGDLTVSAWGLSIDPANGQVLYARNADGPVQSVDGGSHWHPLNRGLDLSDRMTSFLVDRSGQHLYVGTYGGGLYTFDFSSSRSVVPVIQPIPIGVGTRDQ